MGISGLWDVLGKGEEFAIADYAAAHWEKHKRPLRIAVDEPCWRFNNLTDEQVAKIREGEPAANPIEITILWRILNLWKMNIQLLFVTDGMKKPGKKRWNKKTGGGRGGSRVDKDVIKMLHQMFDRLHVPYHMAPGEAEAECARLQQLGIVDAVWSDDGDCLMFGCTTLIRAHRNVRGQKEWNRIQVYRAENVLPKFDFDTDSLVMFAITAGGDYDDKGLPDCGTQKAKILCQRNVGLAQTLRHCESKYDFDAWRNQLATTIRGKGYGIMVPPDFPYVKAVEGYRRPAISTDDQCHNLRGLHVKDGGWEWWESQMDQTKLRVVLRSHYNLQTRRYLKHLGPVFLARALTRNVNAARREENLSCGVSLRRTQNRKDGNGEDIGQPSEVNIKYNPAMLVHIDLSIQPPEEDWSCTVKNDGIQYDPMKPIDGVMLSCFLTHGLPAGALEKPATSPATRGQKLKDTDVPDKPEASQAGPASSQLNPTARGQTKSTTSISADVSASQIEPRVSLPKTAQKRKARSELVGESTKPTKKLRKSNTADETPSVSPPPATFRRLTIPNLVTKKCTDLVSKAVPEESLVIDLDDNSDSDGFPDPTPMASSMPNDDSYHSSHNLPAKAHPGSSSAGYQQSSKPAKSEARVPIGAGPSWTMSPITACDTGSPSQISRQKGHTIVPASLPPSLFTTATSSLERLGLASSSAAEDIDPTVTPSAATLRQRRETGLLSKLSKPAIIADHALNLPAAPPVSIPEVIDLT